VSRFRFDRVRPATDRARRAIMPWLRNRGPARGVPVSLIMCRKGVNPCLSAWAPRFRRILRPGGPRWCPECAPNRLAACGSLVAEGAGMARPGPRLPRVDGRKPCRYIPLRGRYARRSMRMPGARTALPRKGSGITGPAIRGVARGASRMPPGRELACGMCACDGNGGAGSAGTCGAILHIPIRPRRLIRRRRREHHARFGLTIPIMPPSKRLTQRQEAPMFPLPPPAPRRRAGARRTDRKTVPDSYGLPPPSLPAGDAACCRMQSTPVS